MPINLYKKILDLAFEKKEAPQSLEAAVTRKVTYGLVARPVVFLSEDGNLGGKCDTILTRDRHDLLGLGKLQGVQIAIYDEGILIP